MAKGALRLSDLRDKKVRTLDGKTIGRVHDVHCDKGSIVALMCGAASFIERLTARDHGRRIPWDSVTGVNEREITVDLDGPARKPTKKASGSRTPKGTRPASGKRSKR